MFMKLEFGATLGFHGESSACSGTSALQDRATAFAPSFPEYLEVFLEDRGSSNELVNSEKKASEILKASLFKEKPIIKSITVDVPTSSALLPNYSI